MRGPVILREKIERHKFVRDPLDFYVEERWPSERLFDVEKFEGGIVDPCAGTGNIMASAARHGIKATGCDITPRPGADHVEDFMSPLGRRRRRYPNIVCNPPFGLCTEAKGDRRRAGALDFGFVKLAVSLAERKVALFLPTEYLNGERRQAFLKTTPLYRVYYLSPRPFVVPGANIKPGEQPSESGFVDFCWMVWLRGFQGDWTGHFLTKGANGEPRRRRRATPA